MDPLKAFAEVAQSGLFPLTEIWNNKILETAPFELFQMKEGNIWLFHSQERNIYDLKDGR